MVTDTSYEIGEDSLLLVETTSGDLQVTGDDGERVELQSPADEARVEREGSTLHIKARSGGHHDLALRVPSRCMLVLRSASGDIMLTHIAGQANVQSMSGQVTAREVTGELRTRTMSGDIVVLGSQLQDLGIETVSGDCVIESPLVEGGVYEARTVSGDLVLRLPQGQRCTVEFASLSGDFVCKLPHEIDHRGWGKLEARVQGGGPAVNMRSTSGDLRIEGSGQEDRPTEMASPRNSGATRPLTQEAAQPFGLDEQPVAMMQDTRPMPERRMEILKAIEAGRMTVSEGLAKLRALD